MEYAPKHSSMCFISTSWGERAKEVAQLITEPVRFVPRMMTKMETMTRMRRMTRRMTRMTRRRPPRTRAFEAAVAGGRAVGAVAGGADEDDDDDLDDEEEDDGVLKSCNPHASME